jgi:hypothetical protein
VSLDVNLGSPGTADPPPQIQELINVIRSVTALVKAQANDLSRSKRFRRLISSLNRPAVEPAEGIDDERPALLYWLFRVDEIIDPLEVIFINELIAAYSADPDRFRQLGLTVDSPAWRLKQAGYSVAEAYANSPPSKFKTAEAKIVETAEKREPQFKLGDSIIGTGLAAIPAVGGSLSEGYQEVKENLEALGGLLKKTPSALGTAGKAAGRATLRVFKAPLKILRRHSVPAI